jgi:serine protease Do
VFDPQPKAQAFALVTSDVRNASAFGYGSNTASLPPARRITSRLASALFPEVILRMKYPALLVALLGLGVATHSASAIDQKVLDAQQRRIDVLEKISPSVVAIFGKAGEGGGSGVLISPDGFALSNFHVTSAAGSFMKCGLNDGVLYDAVIVGIDPTGDVALIQMLGRDDFPYATFGNSDDVKVGDWAYAVGNPFLLATDFQPTVTYGIVSGVHRYQYPAGSFLEYADCIQVDSSINPGNSGGPLFNDNGELIGINGRGSFEKRGRVNSGAGYAISINQIRHFLDHLRSGRVVDHATLGAAVTTDSEGRVVVSSILESSEAYRRGLRIDDEIVSFAERPIRSVNQFKNILGIYPKGWRLPLTYRREQQKYDILARLRGVHTPAELLPKPAQKATPGMPTPPGHPAAEDDDEADKGPEKFRHMYVDKAGYTNWWFNQQEQKRLKPLVQRWGDWSKQTGRWTISGKNVEGDDFRFVMTDKGLGLEMRGEPYFQALDGSEFTDEPPGSGGLLVAMNQLKRMLTGFDQGFSEFYYLGSEPLALTGDPVDVIVTSVGGVETRWYFTVEPAAFVGFSTQLLEDRDECEIFFATIDEFDGRFFPGTILIHSGGREYLRLKVEKIETEPAKAEPAKAASTK